MAKEQQDLWTAFDESLDSDLTSEWAQMSTEPELDKGVWKSVFLMNENKGTHFTAHIWLHLSTVVPGTSITRALLELNRLEEQDSSSRNPPHEQGYTAPSWVSEGIEIETQQYVIHMES